MRNLDYSRLTELLTTVFAPAESEKDLLVLVDLPTASRPDTQPWMDRRRLAAEWYTVLQANIARLPFAGISCAVYDNVGTNNADLPLTFTLVDRCTKEEHTSPGRPFGRDELLGQTGVLLSLAELSATAPLKVLAKQLGFRGASMPGFSRAMLPTLLLDYEQIDRRVRDIKQRLDHAEAADIIFRAAGIEYRLLLDLRFRSGHASGGLIREGGVVANLPSGEAYIVPYEGEREGAGSRTEGHLPVEIGGEIVVFNILGNKAISVQSSGRVSEGQRSRLLGEPAYGNIAELGIGVLGEFGVTAVGQTLVDEKLGLHIAFGRSDHFGGVTGPSAFHNPKSVVHIDWVYVPSVQPHVSVQEASLVYSDRSKELIVSMDNLVV